MSEERRRILNLLAEGKITAVEAESLLKAVEGSSEAPSSPSSPSNTPMPKYLRVLVEDAGHTSDTSQEGEEDHHDHEHLHGHGHHRKGGKVNIRIPIQLIRAGVKLAALLPSDAQGAIASALTEKGLKIDISQLKPENIDEFIRTLGDTSIDVEGDRGETVRIFCE